jgi:hypothetical protein
MKVADYNRWEPEGHKRDNQLHTEDDRNSLVNFENKSETVRKRQDNLLARLLLPDNTALY